MKKFRFIGYGNGLYNLKLQEWKYLRNTFTLDNVKPDTFSKSIIKRMISARDGTQIQLRKYHWHSLSLLVIDTNERKEVNKKIAKLKKEIAKLAEDEKVKKYFSLVDQLYGTRPQDVNANIAFIKGLKK